MGILEFIVSRSNKKSRDNEENHFNNGQCGRIDDLEANGSSISSSARRGLSWVGNKSCKTAKGKSALKGSS